MESRRLAGRGGAAEVDSTSLCGGQANERTRKCRRQGQDETAVADCVAGDMLLPTVQSAQLPESVLMRCCRLQQQLVVRCSAKALIGQHKRIVVPADPLSSTRTIR